MNKKLNCVLVVDDDEPTNYITTMVFDEVGCADQLLVFESGEAALDHIRQAYLAAQAGSCSLLADMIFVDINMPRMNGWEFLEALQQFEPPLSQTVIIMLTTSLNPDDKQRAESMTAVSGFENKPITPAMVERLLQEHFPKKGETTKLNAHPTIRIHEIHS